MKVKLEKIQYLILVVWKVEDIVELTDDKDFLYV